MSGVIPATSNEDSGPGAETGCTGCGISVSAAATWLARPSTIDRPIPPPTTASAPRPMARARNGRRPVADVAGTPARGAAASSIERTWTPTIAWTAADRSEAESSASGRRSIARSPTPTSPTMPTIANDRRRRASSPNPAPMASTVSVTSTRMAGLSFVPNSATAMSFDPGGAKSMTAAPTAAIGEGAPVRNAAMSSPTASAAPAATIPDTAALVRVGRARAGRTASAGIGWLAAVVLICPWFVLRALPDQWWSWRSVCPARMTRR